MYTQLWAVHLSFVTLACLHRLLERGTGRVASVLACSALALSHLIYAYILAVAGLVLFLVGLTRANARPRLVRLGVTAVLAGLIGSYLDVPWLLFKAYMLSLLAMRSEAKEWRSEWSESRQKRRCSASL